MPLLGAHMPGAGGLHLVFDRIKQVGGEAVQLFTKNQRQWQSPGLKAEAVSAFRRAGSEMGQFPVAAHNSYLINLAAVRPEIEEKSVAAMIDEINRAAILGIPYLVMHAGSHLGAGVAAGLNRFVRNLDQAMAAAESSDVMVLVETTAGQGTGLGSSFEELAGVFQQSNYPERLGVCLDTCHIFAAGYDIRTRKTYEETFSLFDRTIGLDRIRFFHLNDSQKGLGSRVDRHEHIGKGKIGLEGFRFLLNDPRFSGCPMVLETPKGKDLREDIENLALLRGLMHKE